MCDADLTTFMGRMSLKSGRLNLLEPSGPHRACYGTPLPFTSYSSIVSSILLTEMSDAADRFTLIKTAAFTCHSLMYEKPVYGTKV